MFKNRMQSNTQIVENTCISDENFILTTDMYFKKTGIHQHPYTHPSKKYANRMADSIRRNCSDKINMENDITNRNRLVVEKKKSRRKQNL